MLTHRLTHIIQMQKPIEEQEQDQTTGEMITTWESIELSAGKPNIPAEVLTGPGKEVSKDAAKLAQFDARINVRWFPYSIQELYKCRILWEGQVFNIESVETDRTARQEWRFKCSSGVSASGA